MPYDKPNYTQTPNLFFDEHLPAITSLAELKVTLLILRRTLGWHTSHTKLSLSGIMKAAGLSRECASNGIGLALKRGTILREPDGQSFTYEANISVVGKADRSSDINQSGKPTTTGRESRPKVVGKADHYEPSPILVKESIKKGKKGVVLKPPFSSKGFLSTLADFESHRKELKKPLTDRARKIYYGKFKKMGEEISIQAMEDSIANGWQGIFEPRDGNGHSPKPTRYEPEEPLFHPSPEDLVRACRIPTIEQAVKIAKDTSWENK